MMPLRKGHFAVPGTCAILMDASSGALVAGAETRDLCDRADRGFYVFGNEP
jgi:hypothetical protein